MFSSSLISNNKENRKPPGGQKGANLIPYYYEYSKNV